MNKKITHNSLAHLAGGRYAKGGINFENMKDWIQAVAVAVGIDSDLTKAYRKNGAEGVTALAQNYTDMLGRVTELILPFAGLEGTMIRSL